MIFLTAEPGAGFFAKTIREIRKKIPGVFVEVLIPDFQGNTDALQTVLDARPDVLNHNIETVPRLYPSVRPEADYRRSLEILRRAKQYGPAIPTKSGLMLGLGELPEEINKTLRHLLEVGCSMLTLGQYLQPSKEHLQVDRFIHPDIPKNLITGRKPLLEWDFLRLPAGRLCAVLIMQKSSIRPWSSDLTAFKTSRSRLGRTKESATDTPQYDHL
jgi:hypothetical protein